jgi:putative MFS transporter
MLMEPEATGVTEQSIAARIERLPLSRWHLKMRVMLGVATFFDAFDGLAVAYVLPVLIGAWKIAPPQIGALLSIGFGGQAIGALFFGWLAERIGRIPTTRITISIFAVMSLVCAAAQTYDQLFWFRFLQGVGLGGEVPIAAAYISEISQSARRGRFFVLYEVIFPIGILISGFVGAWVVPRFGWQWMFIIGGLPALLAVVLQRTCPESPRWLASRGRLAEADATLRRIEAEISDDGARPLPAVPPVAAMPAKAATRWSELFSTLYRTRTFIVWVLWTCSYLVSFGLVVWLPSIYRTVFGLPVQQALNYSLLTSAAGLLGSLSCAFTLDRIGRRWLFIGSFLLCTLSLAALGILGASTLTEVVVLSSVAYFAINATNNAIYLYTAEIYPTRMRALGGSTASFWLRFSSFVGPYTIGWILPVYGIRGMFVFFGVIAAVGGIAALGAVETKGKLLEEISP